MLNLKHISSICAFAMLAAPGFAASPSLTSEAKRDLKLQPGIVVVITSVTIKSGDFKPLVCSSSGTGFLYRPDGYLITNGHVVESANIKEVTSRLKLADFVRSCSTRIADKQSWTDAEKSAFVSKAEVIERPEIEVILNNNESHRGEIKLMSEPIGDGGKDVAIIKIDGQNLPTVPLGTSSRVSVGQRIHVIGYPGAANIGVNHKSLLVPSWSNGEISALKEDFKGTPVLQSEANINHGNSGGPAFDDEGRVIGIATYGSQEASGFNFFVPIDTAWEFVRQVGAQPQSGSFDSIWAEALDAYAGGHWTKAHKLLGSVLEMMQNQPDATRLRQIAAEQESAMSPVDRIVETVETTNKSALFGGGGILLALLIGGGLLIGTRHNAKPIPAPIAPPASSAAAPRNAENKTVVESLGSLYISSGPTKGRQYAIPKDGLRIGRDPDACNIVLPLETVGREHAWVMPMENGQIAVIDRGSANGTYLNTVEGDRIRKVLLKSGDRILICRDNPIEIVYQRV